MLGCRLTQLIGLVPVLFAMAVLGNPVEGLPSTGPETGTLTIQAIQGTPGGPKIGAMEVEVVLYHENRAIKSFEFILDQTGRAVLEAIPLGHSVRPVVRVKYAGVTYQEVGELMDISSPQQAVDVVCYEVTNDIPDWKMSVRQVMLSYAPQGIRVTEILVVTNPDGQTWLGVERPHGKPVTMELKLPVNAKEIKLGSGFHDWCCTSVDSGVLVNHLPLMPKTTELDFSYIIETHDGSFDLDLLAPAGIEQMTVVLPEDMHAHSVDGLSLGGTRQIADTSVRYYTASNLTKDSSIRLSLSGLPMIHALAAQTSHRTPVNISPEFLIVVVLSGVVLFAGGSVVFKMKSSH